jgi:MraZ protein
MRYFTGQFERSIDDKHRVQIPSQWRAQLETENNAARLYVTLGEHRGTLSIFSERDFEDLATRIATEVMPGPAAQRFELQFYALASQVDVDKQGRFVLPERLAKKARLAGEVVLVGQKNRIDVWKPEELERSIGIDWEGDDWPDWQGYLRMPAKLQESRPEH